MGNREPELRPSDEPHEGATPNELSVPRLQLDRATLVVYRITHPHGRRSVLVAPRNPAVKPGVVVVCSGGTAGAQQVSFDPNAADVEIWVADAIEPSDLDI